MLVEHDDALLVAHDVVAVQAVAELIEIVFALGTLVAFGGKYRLEDLVRVGRARLVDRRAEDADRVVGPGAVKVGRNIRDRAVESSEYFRFRARVDGEVGDAVDAPDRGAGKFHRARPWWSRPNRSRGSSPRLDALAVRRSRHRCRRCRMSR